jgi:hypothetical protein
MLMKFMIPFSKVNKRIVKILRDNGNHLSSLVFGLGENQRNRFSRKKLQNGSIGFTFLLLFGICAIITYLF